jgi:ABC-type nitrate/sulfonate/bicarbonate transport system substrate-binding protein
MRSKKKGVKKRDLVAYLKGLARADEFIEQERMQRLARMTPEESRALYTELVESWDRHADQEVGLERLAEWRLETKLAVRRSFMRLFEAQRGRS